MLPKILSALARPILMVACASFAASAAHAGELSLDAGGLSLGLKVGGTGGHVAVHVGGYGDAHGGKVKVDKIGYGPQRRVVSGCSLHPRCAPARHWVPGHFEAQETRVWIPERKEKVWVPAVYGTRFDACGRAYQVLIRPARWSVVCDPGHFETRRERVWIAGCFETTCAVY
jgi:hypothetical protein